MDHFCIDSKAVRTLIPSINTEEIKLIDTYKKLRLNETLMSKIVSSCRNTCNLVRKQISDIVLQQKLIRK